MKKIITMIAAILSVTSLYSSDTSEYLEAHSIDLTKISEEKISIQVEAILYFHDKGDSEEAFTYGLLIKNDELRNKLIKEIELAATTQPCELC